MAKKNKLLKISFQEILDPKMDALGFETAFPNYRRVQDGWAHLGEIQWGKNGGYFLFEFGRTELPYMDWTDTEVPLQNLTVSHLPLENRARLASSTGKNPDQFHYAPFYDDATKIEALVTRISTCVDQASEWMRTGKTGTNLIAFS